MIVSLPAGQTAFLSFFNTNAAGQIANADAVPTVRRVYRNGQDATTAESASVAILNPNPGEYIAQISTSGASYDTVSVLADASNAGAASVLDVGGYIVAPAPLTTGSLQSALTSAVAAVPLFEQLQAFLNSSAGSSSGGAMNASGGAWNPEERLPTDVCGQGAFGNILTWTIALDASDTHNWAQASVKLFIGAGGGEEENPDAASIVNGYSGSALAVTQSGSAVALSYTLQPGDTSIPGRYAAWVTATGTDSGGSAWADDRTLGRVLVLAAGAVPGDYPSAPSEPLP